MTEPLPSFSRPPVFLSASVPLADRHPKFLSTADLDAIRDAVIDLASAVLPVTGLVYGGHPAITPLIDDVASQLRARKGKVVLFQSEFFVKTPPPKRANVHLVMVPRYDDDRDRSLAEMREQMITSYPFTSAVFIGGMEGVIDEFDLFRARYPNATLLPVKTTGAAAAIIYDTKPQPTAGWPQGLDDDLAYFSLFRRLLQL